MVAQAANFLLRVISLVVLARLLTPKDFGLVGMVTAFTGVLLLFRDFGLSSAAIQRATVSEEQVSTLFWINMLVGFILALMTFALAPVVAAFYHEPRLVAVTAALALSFIFNAAGVQHSVLLQRQMRFTAMAVVSTVSLIIGTVIAIGGALAGYGYWALVTMSLALPLTNTIGLWIATKWIPGKYHRGVGILSMMRFGGTMTLNGLILYCASNLDKVLLGRFWGVDALGIYGRAFQLINIPTDNLNQAVGEVAFSALSRVQHDPPRLRNYFLKGYSLVLALTLPITAACALFSNDMILVLLGRKWMEAAPLFRFLAPTIFAYAIVNPLGWLMSSLGLVGRSLRIALVLAPTMIAGYSLGLHYGPKGVAFAYSAVLTLWVIPLIVWAVRGTGITFWDCALVVSRPLASCTVAAIVAFVLQPLYASHLRVLPRLVVEVGILFVIYAGMLLYVMGQKPLYVSLIRGFRARPAVEEEAVVSV